MHLPSEKLEEVAEGKACQCCQKVAQTALEAVVAALSSWTLQNLSCHLQTEMDHQDPCYE